MLPGSRLASSARRTRAALVIGAVVGTVALGGCAAGQVAQTASQANSSSGATVTVNGIAIRDAKIAFGAEVEGGAVYLPGASAAVEMHIINQNTEGDRLVSASSPVASSVVVSGQTDLPGGIMMVVSGGAPAAEEAATAAPTAEASAAPSAEVTAAPSVAPTAEAGAEAPAVTPSLPPIAAIVPSTRSAQVVLTGLTEEIRAGLPYEIDLTFERAGVIRVNLPVAYPAVPREDAEKAE